MIGTWFGRLTPLALAALVAIAMGDVLLAVLTRFGPAQGAVAVFALPLLLAAFAAPGKKRLLLWVTVLTLPIAILYLPPRSLIAMTLGDATIAAMALLMALDRILAEDRSARWEKTIFTWPLLFLLLVALISAVLSGDPRLAFSDLLENVRYVLFYAIFANQVRTKDDLKFASRLIIVGFVPSVFLGLAQFYLGIGLEFFGDALPNTGFVAEGVDVVRVSGPFQESLVFAQYLIVPSSFLVGLALYARRPATIAVLAGLLGLGCLALVLTLSRGTWTAFSITLVLLAWWRTPKRFVPYAALCCAVAAIAAIGYWDLVRDLVPESIAARISGSGDDFFIGRGYLWSAVLGIVADHPLFGIGLRNLFHVLPVYAPAILADPAWNEAIGLTSPLAGLTGYTAHTHVDSLYVTLLAEIGIIGVIPLAILFVRAIAQALANYRNAPADLKPYALGIAGALVGLTLSMATTYAYSDMRMALLLWLLLAMTVVLRRLIGSDAAA